MKEKEKIQSWKKFVVSVLWLLQLNGVSTRFNFKTGFF